MSVSSLTGIPGGSNLARTADAISAAQSRFDDLAARVVDSTMAESGATPTASTLVGDVVGMKAEAITNSILYSLFQKQSEQQQVMLDAILPANNG